MKLPKTLTRAIARVLIISFASISCFAPAAQAAMVGTDQLMASEQAQNDRAQLKALLNRADLAEQLQAAGVDPAQLQARVDNLSDEEVATLVDQFEQQPAGSGILGTAVFIFLVLLVTDILGYTNVFPFVKKTVN